MALSDLVVALRLNAKGFEDGLTKASRSVTTNMRGIEKSMSGFKKLGASMTSVGTQMSIGLTAPIVALGAKSLSVFADFEAGMNKVQAVSGATGVELAAMTELAKDMGSKTKFSAKEAAEGMGFMAMAGFEVKDTMDALPSVLQLAAAGAVDLGTAADTTTNILTGYGLSVDDLQMANDTLVATFTKTNTDLTMLGESFKMVGPIAASVGLEFNEMAAAVGLLGNAGIQGEMAGTSLRGAITKLLGPSKEGAEVLEKYGVSVKDASGKMNSMTEIVAQFEEAFKTTGTSASQTSDMITLLGQRAGPGMVALISQGSDALKDLTVELDNAGGTAERVAEVQMQGWTGAMTKMKSATEGMFISIGESIGPMASRVADALAVVANKIAELAEGFAALSPTTQNVILGMTALAAAIGPVLLIVGQLVGAITTLLPVLAGLKVAFLALSGVLTGPVGLIALIGVGLVGAYFALDKSFVKMKGTIGEQTRELAKLRKEWKDGEKTVDEYREAVKKLHPDVAALDKEQEAAADSAWALHDKVADLVNELKDQGIEVDETGKNLQEYYDALVDAKNENSQITPVLGETTEAVKKQKEAIEETDEAWYASAAFNRKDWVPPPVPEFTAAIRAANEALWDSVPPLEATDAAFEELSGGILQSAEDLAKTTPKFEESAKKTDNAWSDAMQNVSTNITNAAQDIVGILIGTKEGSVGDAFKRLGESIVTSFVEPAIAAISRLITGKIAELIASLTGTGGVMGAFGKVGSAISSAFGGGGGGTGGAAGSVAGAAMSGVASAVTAISGVVGAIGSIAQFIQGFEIEKGLDAVEEESRKNQLHNLFSLEKLNEFLPNLKDINTYLWGPGHTTWNAVVARLDDHIVPLLSRIAEKLENGIVGLIASTDKISEAFTETASVIRDLPYEIAASRGGGEVIGRGRGADVPHQGRAAGVRGREAGIGHEEPYETVSSRSGGSRGRDPGGTGEGSFEPPIGWRAEKQLVDWEVDQLLPPAEEAVSVATAGFTALSESTDGMRGALVDARMAIVQSIGMHQTSMAEWFGRVNTNVGQKLDTVAVETRAVKTAINELNITVHASSQASGKQIADAIALRLQGVSV